MIEYKGARIQLLDLPGIIEGASQGRGRGRQVVSSKCDHTIPEFLYLMYLAISCKNSGSNSYHVGCDEIRGAKKTLRVRA